MGSRGRGRGFALEPGITRERFRHLPRADVAPSSGGWVGGVAAEVDGRRRRAAWKDRARAARGLRGVHSAAGAWGREGAGRGCSEATVPDVWRHVSGKLPCPEQTGCESRNRLEPQGDGSRSMTRERQCRGASRYLQNGVEGGIAAGTKKRNNSALKYIALQIVRSKHSPRVEFCRVLQPGGEAALDTRAGVQA